MTDTTRIKNNTTIPIIGPVKGVDQIASYQAAYLERLRLNLFEFNPSIDDATLVILEPSGEIRIPVSREETLL